MYIIRGNCDYKNDYLLMIVESMICKIGIDLSNIVISHERRWYLHGFFVPERFYRDLVDHWQLIGQDRVQSGSQRYLL